MSARRKKLRERLQRRGHSEGGGRARWAEPVEIPECPEGWSTGPPDFVGIGAQRSGTSWWYSMLEAHPQVSRVPNRAKELHYFSRFWEGDPPRDLGAQYGQLFPRAPQTLVGEWTPRYMHDYWALPLLREAAPDAQLLVMLRDPVERYLSGLAFAQRRAEKAGAPLRLVQVSDALARGLYAEQLRHVFRFFPTEQVLVLQFERCRDEPLDQLAATCRFLGIEPPSELPEQARKRRRSREKPTLSDAQRAELVERLAADAIALAQLCPEIDLAMWPSFSHLAGSTQTRDTGAAGSDR